MPINIQDILVRTVWKNKTDFESLNSLDISNQVMFELYFILFTNFIKSAEFISRNDIPILKQTTDDIYTLAYHDEYKLIFFGESPSVLNLFRYFMGCGDFSQNDARGPKIDPPSNKNSLRHSTIIHSEFTDLILNSKIEILENIGDKLFSAISEAISLHWNPRILKDYISIMADLWYNLVRSDFQEHYAKLLKYYLKFLKRLLMQNWGLNRATNKYYESSTKPTILSSKFERLPYPVEIIRINSSSSDYSLRNCHVECKSFSKPNLKQFYSWGVQLRKRKHHCQSLL